MNEINFIGVIGSGTMGNGIAHVASLSNYKVVLVDINDDMLKKALNTISLNMDRQLSKGIITENKKKLSLQNLDVSTNIHDMNNMDLIIEAIPENYKMKYKLFSQLDDICKPNTIIASNTSSISITALGKGTSRVDKIVGMHFMNPVPVMKLVEVVIAEGTSSETKATIINVSKQMGKIPVTCNDYPGFISNRILMPMINEAIFCLEQKVGTKEAIDKIMSIGMAHPMGPLQLADFIGLDTCLSILKVLHTGFENSKYKPCSLLEEMVNKGELGKKTGKGFYIYN